MNLVLNIRIKFILDFFIIYNYSFLHTKRTMNNYHVEYFQHTSPTTTLTSKGRTNQVSPIDYKSLTTKDSEGSILIPRQCSSYRFCNDGRLLEPNNPDFVSTNQKLAGPPNPKTLVPPVIVPPPMALEYWRANNLINHSHINSESQRDTYLSGYEVSNCCDRIDACIGPSKCEQDNEIIEGFDESTYIGISDPQNPSHPQCNPLSKATKKIISPVPATSVPVIPTIQNVTAGERFSAIKENKGAIEGYQGFTCKDRSEPNYRTPLPHGQFGKHTQIVSPEPVTFVPVIPTMKENFEYPYEKTQVRPNESGWVNTTCGYNPEQIKESNLPSNLAVGNCEKSEEMKQYNKNLFTQNLQPDIYTVNEVIEPINSNIGISYTQQFLPKTCKRDENGLTYTEHDPRVFQPDIIPHQLDMSVTESNVYDPRFTGYGTSYRAYNDENVGQTRFYYDDINSVRMPNYVVRSNIDFTNYADHYGPLYENTKNGNLYNSNIRSLAQDTFLRSSLQQRNDLSERLMRKRNSELWQLRKAPMRTGGVFQTGSKRC
jgi:hypothetical protein